MQTSKWLAAVLATMALATPAFAVTADMTGSLQVRAFATNNLDFQDNNEDHSQFVDQRLRLFTNVAANENVKAVFGIEVDNVWGDGNTTNGTSKEVGKMGTDAKGEIEIKHLYLDFNIPALKANVKAGSQAFNLGRGFIINDDAAGLQASLPVGPGSLGVYWIKPYESSDINDQDDIDFYGAKYTVKSGDVTIAPYAGYQRKGQDVQGGGWDQEAYWIGADVDGKAGDLTYGLTAIYNQWSDDKPMEKIGRGNALLAKVGYQMGATNLSAEAARYGDADNGGEFYAIKDVAATGPINNFSEILTGGVYTSNTNSVNYKGAANLYSANYQYIKLGAVQKISDASKLSGYIMHIEQAQRTGSNMTQDEVTYGEEVDLYYDYTIVPGLTLNLAAAYLFADNETKRLGAGFDGDDPWKLATSLNYKF